MSKEVVLITGASSGIGEAIAKLLGENGYQLLLGARRVDKLEKIVQQTKNSGGVAEAMYLDVTNIESINDFIKMAIDIYGRIDVLVNNAGVMLLSNVSNLKFAEWEQMVNVNLLGTINTTSVVLPCMKKQKSGMIINVGSTASYRVSTGAAIYSATKYGIRAFSDGLRKEETNNGIKVCLISPGPAKTELLNHISSLDIKEDINSYVENYGIDPIDIAKTVLYALSLPKTANIDELIISTTTKA